jgi:hypothetical protein
MEDIQMSNRKTLDERIAAAQKEAEEKQNRLKLLLQQQKTAERKARNHRLCERGGKVESRLPRLALLNDEQFDLWMKKTLLSGHAEKYLNEILPPPPPEAEGGADAGQGNADTGQNGESIAPSAARNEHNPAPKPTQTAKPQGTADGSSTVDAARVAG